eukprot:2589286-Amphidinium_carterae.1
MDKECNKDSKQGTVIQKQCQDSCSNRLASTYRSRKRGLGLTQETVVVSSCFSGVDLVRTELAYDSNRAV